MSIPSTISVPFSYAVKTINPVSVLAQLDSPTYGDELRHVFFNETGVNVSHDWDEMLAAVYGWANSNPDYDAQAGRTRKSVAL